MFPHLQKQVNEEFSNFKQYLQHESVIDLMLNRYYNITLKPPEKHANLTPSIFKDFVERCFPKFYQSVQYSEIIQIYRDLLRANDLAAIARDNSKKVTSMVLSTQPYQDQLEKLRNKIAELDTQNRKIDQDSDLRKEIANSDFSLRSFVYGVLFQSPLTVIEKLDIIFDIGELCSKFVDGIDSNEALSLCESVLKQHQYFLPSNELRTLVGTIFNKNGPANILGAFWTSKSLSEIKYDLDRNEENGCLRFETFLNSELRNKKVDVVDITKEIQETFGMYQNLYGNKIIDFNGDSSPFQDLNSFFSSQSKGDLGTLLIQKTKQMESSNRFRLCLVSKLGSGERITLELKYSLETGLLISGDLPDEKNKFKKFFMRNINILDLSSKQGAVGKFEFFQGAQKIPFVYDLLRAETFWQDRQLENIQGDDLKSKLNQKNTNKKAISLKMKQKLQSIVSVYVSDKDKIFIFKFENKTIPSGKQGAPKELSNGQIYLFEMDSLFLEDIIMDMRDRIISELQNFNPSNFNLSPSFISEIEGKMEFYVRKISQQSQANIQWLWRSVNDFERIEKFSDDEVFEDEVIFKLVNSNAFNEEIMDDTPQHLVDGYDCFSIYKHSDNSYEWRLCKIMGKELRPEFKAAQQIIEKFQTRNVDNTSQKSLIANLSQVGGKKFQNEQEQFFYFLEFEHLRDQGKEMWVKRRREDIIFSANQARDLPNFEMNCYKYILETYMSKKRQ